MESRILNDESFTPVAWNSRPYKVIDDKKGYVYITGDVSRALYTENSRLYLIHVDDSFTPGYAAVQNGMSGYGGNNYLHSGMKSLVGHMKLKMLCLFPSFMGVIMSLMWRLLLNEYYKRRC